MATDGYSTNGMTSWAVDLGEIGAVYPFQGTEFILFLAGVAFWIYWHVAQFRVEKAELKDEMAADKSGDEARDAISRY